MSGYVTPETATAESDQERRSCRCGRDIVIESKAVCVGCGETTRTCDCPRPSDIEHLERAKAALERGWTQGEMIRIEPTDRRMTVGTWVVGGLLSLLLGIFLSPGWGWAGFFGGLLGGLTVTWVARWRLRAQDPIGVCGVGALAVGSATLSIPFWVFVFGHIPFRVSNLVRVNIPESDTPSFRTEWGRSWWLRSTRGELAISRYNEGSGRTRSEMIALFDRAITMGRSRVLPSNWNPYSFRRELRRRPVFPSADWAHMTDIVLVIRLIFVNPILEFNPFRHVQTGRSKDPRKELRSALLAGKVGAG